MFEDRKCLYSYPQTHWDIYDYSLSELLLNLNIYIYRVLFNWYSDDGFGCLDRIERCLVVVLSLTTNADATGNWTIHTTHVFQTNEAIGYSFCIKNNIVVGSYERMVERLVLLLLLLYLSFDYLFVVFLLLLLLKVL